VINTDTGNKPYGHILYIWVWSEMAKANLERINRTSTLLDRPRRPRQNTLTAAITTVLAAKFGGEAKATTKLTQHEEKRAASPSTPPVEYETEPSLRTWAAQATPTMKNMITGAAGWTAPFGVFRR
jgi:hypothetical protein